jgi:tol-pal system protein YbgF
MGLDFQEQARCAVAVVIVVLFAFLSGCVAQQADLKQTERNLQQRMKQQDDQLSQARARQGQEISTLREQELPQLRGDLEKALHQARELQAKQEDLKHRSAQLEQQTKKLEQLAAKMDADSTTRHAWVQKSLDNQDAKVAARLDEITKAMESAMAALKKDIVEIVQRTNEGLAKRVDAKLDEQQKSVIESHHRLDQVSQKFTQFNQALTGFKEALTGLNDRAGQSEQTSKALVARIDADAKASSAHVNEVNKSVTSVAKALESVGQKVTARLDEQDRRIESVAQKVTARFEEQDRRIESVVQFAQKVTARFEEQDRRIESIGKSVEQIDLRSSSRQQPTKEAQRPVAAPGRDGASPEPAEQESSPAPLVQSDSEGTPPPATIAAPQEPPAVEAVQSNAEPPDKIRYERVLTLFRDGDLEGARHGFAAFLSDYPNSDLAPNARYWLGESYYGKKDFRKAIDAYDKVQVDYPSSEKVPAAILKKGYAYLALKDKKRASSAFKQVVTLYPKSPEAGKASDKLAQLKEVR